MTTSKKQPSEAIDGATVIKVKKKELFIAKRVKKRIHFLNNIKHKNIRSIRYSARQFHD